MPQHAQEPASSAPEMITTEDLVPHWTHPGPTSHDQDHEKTLKAQVSTGEVFTFGRGLRERGLDGGLSTG
jgi:hypothetical protein